MVNDELVETFLSLEKELEPLKMVHHSGYKNSTAQKNHEYHPY